MASDMNDYFNKKKSEGGGFNKSTNNSSGDNNNSNRPNIDFNLNPKSAVAYFLVALVILLVIAKPFTVIQEGDRGILIGFA